MSDLQSGKDYDRSKVTTERKGQSLIITLCRPEKRNALDANLMFGFMPDVGGTARLTKLIGPVKAKKLIMTARIVDAHEAKAIHLFNDVVDDAYSGALELAQAFNKNAPLAMGPAKRVINLGQPLDIKSFVDLEGIAQTSLVSSEDVREGLMAKIEKRDSDFKGK